MVEPIIFSAIGFLLACLMSLPFIPVVHRRAVRLTTRRVQAAAPSMAEITIQKDHLRAEFAVAARRLEMTVEQMKAQIASQRVELGMKSEMIIKLKKQLFGEAADADSMESYEGLVPAQAHIARGPLAQQAERPRTNTSLPVTSLDADDKIDSLPEVVAPKIAPINDTSSEAQIAPAAIQAGYSRSLNDRIRSLHHIRAMPDAVGKTLTQISNTARSTARSGLEAVGSLRSHFGAADEGDGAPNTKLTTEAGGNRHRSLSDRARALQHIRTLPQVVEKTLGQISSTARGGVEAVGSLRFHFGTQSAGDGKNTDSGRSIAKPEPAATAATDHSQPASPLERALQICKANNVFDQSTSETIQRSLGILGELKRSA